MAKSRDGIFTRKRSPFYWVSYTGPDGKQKQESSGTTSYSEAVEFRANKLTEAGKLRRAGYKTPGEDSFAEVAERFLEKRKRAADRGKITTQTYERERDIVVNTLTPAFDMPFKKIQRLDIKHFMEARENKVKPATLQKEMRLLKSIIDYAFDWEIISTSPYVRIKPPKVERIQQIHFTPAQFRAVLLECRPWLRPIVILANATGLRRSNILGLTPAQINLHDSVWHVPETKNGDAIDVPLTGIVLGTVQYLLAHHEGRATDRVFEGVTGNRVSVEFKRACRRAGVPEGHFHSTRHTAGVVIRKVTGKADVTREALGHRSVAMDKVYQIVPAEELQQAAEATNQHLLKAGVTVTAAGVEVGSES